MINRSIPEEELKSQEINSDDLEKIRLVKFESQGLSDDRPDETERDQEFEDWLDGLEERPKEEE